MRKVLGLVLLMIPMVVVAQSGVDGTWRIDLSKTKVDSKPNIYEVKNGMYSCSTCDPKVNIKADGTPQKVSDSPYIDSETVKVVNDNTIERTGMKGNKIAFRDTLTVSPDGKTMIQKYEGHPMGSDQAVTATGYFSRVGQPESGAHAVSGSWKTDKFDSVSDNGLTFSYALTGDGVNYKAKTGESYSAKFDGKDYPFHGDPGTTSVSLKKLDDHSFMETYKRDGKVVGTSKISLAPDSKTLTIVSQDNRRGTTDTWVAEKQESQNAAK